MADLAAPPHRHAGRVRFFRRPGCWILALAGLLAAGVLVTWVQKYEESGQKFASPPQSKAVGPEKGLVALAWVDPMPLKEGHPFRLWVLFENRSSSAALGLRFLAFQIAGFRPVRPDSCWAGGPACRPQGQGKPFLVGLPPRIEKGGAVSVFAVLEPRGESGLFGASGVFSWQDERGARWENAVVLPATQLASRADRFWLLFGKILLFLKDLLLPAAVAYLGWYLQRRDKDAENKKEAEALLREQREREQEREREEKDREIENQRELREKEQARLNETLHLMLPRSHANAEKHYLPVAAAIQAVLGIARETAPDSSDETWQRLLWSILQFKWRMRHLSRSIGGFYFRSLEGEALAGKCADLFGKTMREALGSRDESQAINDMTKNESFATFVAKLSWRPAGDPASETAEDSLRRSAAALLHKVEAQLRRQWVAQRGAGLQDALPLLELLYCILIFETNRPFELWYGEPARFPDEDFGRALERLDSAHAALKARLERYWDKIKGKPSTG